MLARRPRPSVAQALSAVPLVLLVAAVAVLTVGAWDLARPAGLLTLGVLLLAVAVLLAIARGYRPPARSRR